MEDDVVVAPGKPLAQSLLWKSLSLRSMEYQAQEDKMLIQAEAALFVILRGRTGAASYAVDGKDDLIYRRTAACWMPS